MWRRRPPSSRRRGPIEIFRESSVEARHGGRPSRPRPGLSGRAASRELAETDFSTAIRHFEDQRELMSDRQYRASFFQEGWQVFAEIWLGVQIVWHKNAAAGLDYAERGRARTLARGCDRVFPGFSRWRSRAVQAACRRAPPSLFFMTLDDRLLIWTVRKAEHHPRRAPDRSHRAAGADRPDALAAASSRPRTARARGATCERCFWSWSSRSVPTSRAGRYHRRRPGRSAPRAAVFAALIDPRTGRYLVQDFVVMTAPSLSTLVRTTPLAVRPGKGSSSTARW